MKKEVIEVFECPECGKDIEIDNISYEYIVDLEKRLSETEEKLKDAYESIIGMVNNSCCRSYSKSLEHSDDCIVLEAQTWLEDKE